LGLFRGPSAELLSSGGRFEADGPRAASPDARLARSPAPVSDLGRWSSSNRERSHDMTTRMQKVRWSSVRPHAVTFHLPAKRAAGPDRGPRPEAIGGHQLVRAWLRLGPAGGRLLGAYHEIKTDEGRAAARRAEDARGDRLAAMVVGGVRGAPFVVDLP